MVRFFRVIQGVLLCCVFVFYSSYVKVEASTYGADSYGSGQYNNSVVSNGPIVSGGGGGGATPILSTSGSTTTVSATTTSTTASSTEIGTSSSTTGITGIVLLKTDLRLGSTAASVKVLQTYLNQHGFVVAKTGPGSPGHESTYFGARTKAALSSFQKKNGIVPASGFFGPLTRQYIRNHP